MATHLYLIRHGEAVANVEGILAGMRADAGLTPLGVAQAERLRDRLSATGEIQADVLIASTLPRARQTAEVIAPALGLPIILEDEAHELRPGDADGLTVAEYIEMYGPFSGLRRNPFRPLAPNGESWGDFAGRASRLLYRLVHEYEGQTVVLVCHGGVVDISMLMGMGANLLAPSPGLLHTRNTSITHWERDRLEDMEGADVWRLHSYNDNLHTRDIGSVERMIWTRFTGAVSANEPAAPLPTEEDEEKD